MALEWTAIAIVATLCMALSVEHGATRGADQLIYDVLLKFDRREPRGDIVVVAIDNRSLRALGRWPWPRSLHTRLLKALAQARPKAIAYDVLFVEPAPDPQDDQALATAIKAAGPTVLPLLLETSGGGTAFRVTAPVEPIASAAAGVGQANLQFDSDGVARRVFLAEADGARRWPHMMALVRDRIGGVVPTTTVDSRAEAAGPLRGESSLLIPFVGPPGSFRTVSFVDALRGETPAAVFHDKIVLVGATADGLLDRYPTPVSTRTELLSGVELQANILDALLSRRLIRPLSTPWAIALSLLPLAVLMAGFLAFRPKQNMALGVGLGLALPAASAALLLSAGLWFPPATAMAGLFLVYPLWSWRRLAVASAYIVEELNALQQEPDVLPVSTNGGPGPGLGGDEIDREIFLMHDAIRRVRDLRRFVADALHGLPDATLVLGADGQVLLANEEAQSLFRATAAETLAGRDLSALLDAIAVVDPESSASRGDPAWTAPQLEIHTRIGQALELRSTVFRDSAGAFTGWIVRLSDITAMKTAARQREQVMQLLSHDMRSPQVSILALLRARQPDAPIPAEQAQRIDGYAQHTLALADDFLSLARAEQPHYTIEAVNFADLLIEAIDALWPQSHAKSVTLNAEGCDQDYPVAGDRSLLLRALVNLIDNAIKFSAPNSAVHCALSRLEAPEQAVCTIRDHGRGMSAETRGGLFQPFHRGTQDGPAVGGVGLGLTFVRTVVLRHHGQIACDSVLGAGTTFTIALPLTTGDLETA